MVENSSNTVYWLRFVHKINNLNLFFKGNFGLLSNTRTELLFTNRKGILGNVIQKYSAAIGGLLRVCPPCEVTAPEAEDFFALSQV